MGYVPLFMAVTNQPCVVIGGDAVAEERVRMLLAADASVTIISPSLTPGLARMVEGGTVQHRPHALEPGDLAGVTLAYCVAADDEAARRAAVAARAARVPINVHDHPELSSFIAPAVVRRGPLQIAVSTGGASPALARIIRHELEGSFRASYPLLLAVLAAARRYVRPRESDPRRRAELSHTLARVLRGPILRDDLAAADLELRRHLGVGFAELGIEATAVTHRVRPPASPAGSA